MFLDNNEIVCHFSSIYLNLCGIVQEKEGRFAIRCK